MSNRINPDDFMNDPMFKELRTFGSNTSDLNNELPTEVLMAYRNASAVKVRKVWLRRSIFSILAIGILAPSLSYAQLLPTPVDNVVKRVTHLVTAPIRIVTETVSRVTNSNPPEQNLNIAPDTGTATASPSPTPSQSSTSLPATVPVAPQVQAVPSPTRKSEQHEQEESQTPKPAKSVKPVEQKSEKTDDGESKSSPTPSVSPTSKKESSDGESEKSGASAKPLPAASAAAPQPTVVSGGENKGEAKRVEVKKED